MGIALEFLFGHCASLYLKMLIVIDKLLGFTLFVNEKTQSQYWSLGENRLERSFSTVKIYAIA